MASDEPPPPAETPATEVVRPVAPRRRPIVRIAILVMGLGVASYFASRTPKEQHVRFVLGPAASAVTGLEAQYVGPCEAAGPRSSCEDVAREVRMAFPDASAPRVISHEPSLTDGTYRLKVDLDTREGRRSVERQVTLGGGTTSVDLAGALPKSP